MKTFSRRPRTSARTYSYRTRAVQTVMNHPWVGRLEEECYQGPSFWKTIGKGPQETFTSFFRYGDSEDGEFIRNHRDVQALLEEKNTWRNVLNPFFKRNYGQEVLAERRRKQEQEEPCLFEFIEHQFNFKFPASKHRAGEEEPVPTKAGATANYKRRMTELRNRTVKKQYAAEQSATAAERLAKYNQNTAKYKKEQEMMKKPSAAGGKAKSKTANKWKSHTKQQQAAPAAA